MPRRRQIIGLDALRFAAALMVLLFHFGFWDWTRVERPGLEFPAMYLHFVPISWFGYVGVEVFFVLSGFVIAYSAERVTAGAFFQHRFTRLFPGALICSTLTAVVVLASDRVLGAKAVAVMWLHSVLFLPKGPWIDNSFWTLSIEISFYAVIFALLVVRRYSLMPWVMGVIGSYSTLFLLAVAAPEGTLLGRVMRPAVAAIAGHGIANMLLKILLLAHGCYFAIGVFLWLWLCGGEALGKGRAALLGFWTVGGVLQIVYRSRLLSAGSGFDLSPVLPVALWLAAVALIVFFVKKNEAIHGALGERGAVVLRRAGLMTYPLYLLNQVIGVRVMAALSGRIGWLGAWLVAVGTVIALAYAVAMLAEPPLQRAFKRAFR